MKRAGSFVGVVAMAVMAAACSSFGEEAETSNPAIDPAAPDAPADPKKGAPPPPSVTPPMSELTEKFGYFVTEKGNDDDDGSRAKPFATIAKAMSKAKIDGKRIYVCAGTYAEALTLEDGVSMIGGYDCSRSEWANGTSNSRVVAPSSPAMRAKDIVSKTRFEAFDVIAPNATEPSESSIGLMAENATALVVVSTKIIAGRGAHGAHGVEGIQLVPQGSFDGPNGVHEAVATAAELGSAGIPGVCDNVPSHRGGVGGRGGSGGLMHFRATGGIGGCSLEVKVNATAGEAKAGSDGVAGKAGASASAGLVFTASGYQPADGAPGEDGAGGEGGAGGFGVLPSGAIYCDSQTYRGRGGGAGGAGGCPGLAGSAGKGGGASVAVLLVESPVTFEKSELESADGGNGGQGTFGSFATAGGAGGQGGFCPPGVTCYNSPAENGSPGGRGGEPGVSGAGAGGPSIVIAHHGAAPKTMDTKTKVGRAGFGVAEMSSNGRVIPASADGEAKEVTNF